MKSLLLFFVFVFLVLNNSLSQIDPSIPTPPDLDKKEITIVDKYKHADGYTIIRYRYLNGSLQERKIVPPKSNIMPGAPVGPPPSGWAQPAQPLASATGTGNTTGHIANIAVTNNNDFPIDIVPQIFYIPSDGRYQSYVGRIPEGITVPPNGTADIPVSGVCTDVHTPPVPSGTSMPPIGDWIPVGDPPDIISTDTVPQVPDEMNPPTSAGPPSGFPIVIITNDPQPKFTPDAIPEITGSPGFTPVNPNPEADIIITWPGTNTPVEGTFDPRQDPESFARVIVDVVERVEEAAEVVQDGRNFPTPFTNDQPRERESIIQQQVWIFCAIVTGSKYEKEDFAKNVYDQFTDRSGVAVTTLPPEERKKIDAGIDDFWNAFEAVGVEAKVIATVVPQETTQPADPAMVPGDEDEPPVLIKDEKTVKQCECGDISFELFVWNTEAVPPNGWRGVQENLYKSSVKVSSKAGLPDHEIKAGKKGLKKGSAQIIELRNVAFGCSCIEITEAISDAMKELAKLEKSNRTKLDKAKSDLLKKEEQLKAENEKRRPSKITVDRLTGEIAKLQEKIKELEDPITAKQDDIEKLKKDAKVSDCPAYESATNKIPFPTIKTTSDGKNVDGTWGEGAKAWDYKFTVIKGDAALECRIVISFYCEGDDCKAVQCSRTVVIKVDE